MKKKRLCIQIETVKLVIDKMRRLLGKRDNDNDPFGTPYAIW